MAKGNTKDNGTTDKLTHAEAASLDKVRDILFGKQVRQSEKRFDGIESRLSREIDQLRKDQDKAVTALRADVEAKLASLGEAIEGEKAERAEHVQAVEAELTGRLAELESSAAAAHEKLQDELRGQIAHEVQTVRQELADVERRQAEVLTEAMTQLRSELVGRDKVAELLRGLADTMVGEG